MPGGYWSYRTRWTSGVGGTTGITHTLQAGDGNILNILGFRASAVIAATGTLDINLIDEDGNITVKYADLAAAAAPSATIPRLNDDVDTTTSSLLASSWKGVRIAGSDLRLQVVVGDLAAADTVDLQVWSRVRAGPGTWVNVGVGLYTQAETVSEVY